MTAVARFARASTAAIALASALAFGCSLIVSQDAAQCHSDAECGRFVGTKCVQGGCVPRAAVFDGGIDPSRPCTSTQDCLSLHGSNWVCRRGACEPLSSTECPLVLGNYTADDVLLLGAILPYGQHYKSAGVPIERAIQLAQEDFQGGVPFGAGAGDTGDAGAARHPLAIVLCDETTNPVAAAKHLAEDVHVPLILGPAFGASVLSVASSETNGKQVVLVSPYATADLSPVTGPGFVWRTSPKADGEAAAMAQVASQVIAPSLTSARGHPPAIAIAWSDDADGKALHAALKAALVDALGTDAGATIEDVDYGNPDVPGGDHTQQAVAQLTAPLPDLLIAIGRTEAVTGIVQDIENSPSPVRPFYLLSHGAQVQELLDLAKAAGEGDLHARVLVASPGDVEGTNAPLRELRFRYRALYSDYPAETFGVAQGFDAFYLVAYAIAAVRNRDVGGQDVSAGLRQILFRPSPLPIPIAPESIDAAFTQILAGGSIALQGASAATLAFDPTTETAPSDVAISCVQIQKVDGRPVLAASGLVWRASSSTLEGQLSTACTQATP